MSFVIYADWPHPIDERFANVHAYRARLLARPSYEIRRKGVGLSFCPMLPGFGPAE